MIWFIVFCIASFVIVWAMGGYSASLMVLDRVFKNRSIKKDYTYQPAVTVLVVAHNEEKVIAEKLENALDDGEKKHLFRNSVDEERKKAEKDLANIIKMIYNINSNSF